MLHFISNALVKTSPIRSVSWHFKVYPHESREGENNPRFRPDAVDYLPQRLSESGKRHSDDDNHSVHRSLGGHAVNESRV